MGYGSLTLDLLKHLATEMNLYTNQTPTVWFFDKRLNEDVRLVDEIQMVDLFEMHKEKMTCQVVVGVFDSSICVEHEFDALEPLCMVPPDDVAELGTHNVNLLTQHTSGGTEPTNEPHAAPKNPKAASELEPDIFDNEEEYVGIDDEAMYDEEPTHQTEFSTATC